MTNIDRALRTLSRLQNAAPAVAAARISEVSTLLMRLRAENEYLNARLLETLHTTPDFPMPVSAQGALEKPIAVTDTSLEELFGINGSASDLFADLDATLFTGEVPAVAPEPPPANHHTEREDSALDVYEDLQSLLRQHAVADLPDAFSQQVELTEDERRALEHKFHGGDDDLPTPEELILHANQLLKPALLAMRSDLEGLIDGRLGRLTSNQADTLRTILGTAEGILTLLDSLTVIHQLRENSLKMEPTTFDPLELLETARQMSRERADQHDHQINILADQSLPFVLADFDRSLSIVLDLLDNAIRYTPSESVIRVSADSIGSHVLFTIADSGIGFSTEDSEHVGKPFWRALHEPLVRSHHGTGLRLYLAKQVLALQGGEMFFSGEPNFGSSFSITLPVSPA